MLFTITLWIQTIYYFVTAMWGLLDIKSFMKITGPKTDLWLVKSVSLLLIAASLSFAAGILINSFHWPVAILALSFSASLAFIDYYYASKKVISPVYYIDGIIQSIFLFAWIVILGQHRNEGF